MSRIDQSLPDVAVPDRTPRVNPADNVDHYRAAKFSNQVFSGSDDLGDDDEDQDYKRREQRRSDQQRQERQEANMYRRRNRVFSDAEALDRQQQLPDQLPKEAKQQTRTRPSKPRLKAAAVIQSAAEPEQATELGSEDSTDPIRRRLGGGRQQSSDDGDSEQQRPKARSANQREADEGEPIQQPMPRTTKPESRRRSMLRQTHSQPLVDDAETDADRPNPDRNTRQLQLGTAHLSGQELLRRRRNQTGTAYSDIELALQATDSLYRQNKSKFRRLVDKSRDKAKFNAHAQTNNDGAESDVRKSQVQGGFQGKSDSDSGTGGGEQGGGQGGRQQHGYLGIDFPAMQTAGTLSAQTRFEMKRKRFERILKGEDIDESITASAADKSVSRTRRPQRRRDRKGKRRSTADMSLYLNKELIKRVQYFHDQGHEDYELQLHLSGPMIEGSKLIIKQTGDTLKVSIFANTYSAYVYFKRHTQSLEKALEGVSYKTVKVRLVFEKCNLPLADSAEMLDLALISDDEKNT